MGQDAMGVDPGEPAGVMLEGERRHVGAFPPHSIEALVVASVGGHVGPGSLCSGVRGAGAEGRSCFSTTA